MKFLPANVGRGELERRAGYDVWLLMLTLLLCTWGAVFVLTSSAAHSWRLYDGNTMSIFLNHLLRLGWGGLCLLVMAFVDYRVLAKAARPLWIVSAVALVAVLFLPQPAGATAHRWIYIKGFSFQPAELAKYALIAYLAVRFERGTDAGFPRDTRKIMVGAAAVTALTLILIVIEPNLSMAVLVAGSAGLLFFLSDSPLKPVFSFAALAAVPMALIAWITPYMRSRLTAWVAGIIDPMQTGHQVKQSLVGIGQGGLFGVGLGGSTQKHFFLPEPYKDFIFSIIGEELGLLGAVALLGVLALFLFRAWQIARRAPDDFGYFLGAGITCTIGFSVFINIGVALGLLPATGQPLPLISYGGSSLMMTMGAIGVLLNISRQAQRSAPPAAAPEWFN